VKLWQAHGEADEAKAAVSTVPGRFTVGFDTTGLKEAQGLREQLKYDPEKDMN
jgi:hypothetical protein